MLTLMSGAAGYALLGARPSFAAGATGTQMVPQNRSQTEPAPRSTPLAVVATTGMIADAVTQIAGPFVQVRGLMGSGVDPHSYRQTRSDIVAMVRADLVLWHGLYLEAQMEEFLLKLGHRRAAVAVAESLPASVLMPYGQYENRFDPHVWMAPMLWADVITAVEAALIAAMPQHAEALAQAAARHRAEIAALHGYATAALDQIPDAARVLLTAHDAFGYFGRAYGLEVIGIQGISTQSEAGLNRIGQLVDMLVARDIRAVFVESSVSDRNIRALIEGCAAQGHRLAIGGELFSDAMGLPGTYEATYIGMLDHNITTIARALGADVPPRGMNGQLGGHA